MLFTCAKAGMGLTWKMETPYLSKFKTLKYEIHLLKIVETEAKI